MSIIRASLVAAFLVACSSSSSSGPAPQGLPGTWSATKAEFVNADDANTRVDVVAKGTTVTLVLDTSTFALTQKDPVAAPVVTNGSWTANSDLMTFTPTGMSFSWVFQMALNGNDLSLTGASVEFDFNDDGIYEQAKLNLALVRK